MVDKKYNLAVGAIFNNEEHGIIEWLEHYLYHGVEHFYLIDDNSDDKTLDIIQPYIGKGIISLFNHGNKWSKYLGRQHDMYHYYILPFLHETQWLLMCDLDEFVWSPDHIDLKIILNQCSHLAELQVAQTLFGSNGHITQPKSIVKSFTKRRRSQYGTARTYGYKYFVNSSFPFKELKVHFAVPKNEEDKKNRWLVLDDRYFILNHYSCQSKERFFKKTLRSICANGFKKLTMDDFEEFDTNEVEDDRLFQQNKSIIACTDQS